MSILSISGVANRGTSPSFRKVACAGLVALAHSVGQAAAASPVCSPRTPFSDVSLRDDGTCCPELASLQRSHKNFDPKTVTTYKKYQLFSDSCNIVGGEVVRAYKEAGGRLDEARKENGNSPLDPDVKSRVDDCSQCSDDLRNLMVDFMSVASDASAQLDQAKQRAIMAGTVLQTMAWAGVAGGVYFGPHLLELVRSARTDVHLPV